DGGHVGRVARRAGRSVGRARHRRHRLRLARCSSSWSAATWMGIVYNQIANRSLERIGALSDGLFAIAMTLIVLEIRVPELAPGAGDRDLAQALVDLAPRFVTYLLSFLTLGIFWNGQQTQLSYMDRGN